MGLLDIFRRQPQAAVRSGRVQQIAAKKLSDSMRNLPRGRLSRGENDWMGVFTWLEQSFDGYPDKHANEIRRLLRQATQADDDLAGALRDLQALVNTGVSWEIVGGSRATKQALDELTSWERHVYPGGLPTLVQNQVRELYCVGASSVEWVPDPLRRSVAEAIVVPAETVIMRRNPDTGHVEYVQRALGAETPLHPLTYRYQAIETDADRHAGIPLAISAPAALARKRGIFDGIERVIRLMARAALVTAHVPPPTAQELGVESEASPEFEQASEEYYAAIADLLVANTEIGLYVMPHGEGSEIKATPVPQTATGLSDVFELNQRTVWNAGVTLPFLRGDMSANYALARVVWPILAAVADNCQRALAEQLEFGANLHLRLAGIPAEAFVKWGERASAFEVDEAQAELNRARTDELLVRIFGRAYARRMMQRWDITDEEYENAPEWWRSSSDEGEPPEGSE